MLLDAKFSSVLEVNPPRHHSTSQQPPEGVSIREAARLCGVSVHTLRYYERAGLVLTPVGRAPSGHRRYNTLDLDWIRICSRLRATGMPIRDIRLYAELVAQGRGNESQRLTILEQHRDKVNARIATLHENLRLIEHKVDTYRVRVEAGDADLLWATPSRRALNPAEPH